MSSTRSTFRPEPATDAGAASLVLVGLGSTRAEGNAALFAQRDALRARRRFAEVEAGLLIGEPTLESAVARTTAPVVHVVPFLMADGYLGNALIPRRLRALAGGGRALRLCAPVGVAPGLASVLAERLLACCRAAGLDPAATDAIVAGHGMTGSPRSGRAVRAHVEAIARRGLFASVAPGFLEEEPLLGDVLAAAMRPTVMVGLFAGAGMHAGEDVPRLLAAARACARVPLHDAGPIGNHPDMPEIVLAQVAAAAASSP
jgi:sirohydrochlorin ferrochelatase